MHSKSRIDKAGRLLSSPPKELTEEFLELEDVFDRYRESHLDPLTSLTSEIQSLLREAGKPYYIAQRLKRKPQIVRKLQRLSVRLTQLQDIGGLRVIVDDNETINFFDRLLTDKFQRDSQFCLYRSTDYRPTGRDDSGYRALHKIFEYKGRYLELQFRSRAQHYWAESVERTSVFYGRRIKEGEGDDLIKNHFKLLSFAFLAIESGQRITSDLIRKINESSRKSEDIIRRDGNALLMDGKVNQDVIQSMVEKERSNPGSLNNWILVFDWQSANFITWDIAAHDPSEAAALYSRYEKEFPERENFEVVLIGSSDIATVQKTHSHYFGISRPDKLIEDLGQSIENITDNAKIDYGAKRILAVMAKRKVWGMNYGIQRSTLQNHFCKDVEEFSACLQALLDKGLVINKGGAGVTLDVARTAEIERLI